MNKLGKWIGAPILAIGSTLWINIAIAGNGWNPPVPEQEENLKFVGSSFFKLQGHMYIFLGVLESQDLDAAQELLPVIYERLDVSLTKCNELTNIMGKHAFSLESKYKALSGNIEYNTSKYNDWLIDISDSEWKTAAMAGYSPITNLCATTIEELTNKFAPIADLVQENQFPTSEEVWGLMSVLETGSKRSRYFTVIFRE